MTHQIGGMSDEELVGAGMAITVYARNAPDELAIKAADGATRTWSQLDQRANQLASRFRAAGLGVGDAVALLAHNSVEFIETWAACQRAGLRLTPINWHQKPEIIGYILDNCDARALVASSRFAKEGIEALRLAPRLELKLAFAGSIEEFLDYDRELSAQSPEQIADPVMGTSMLYTSGTTGRPKGVYRASRPAPSQLTATILETASFVPGKDASLVTGPLYHAAPLALNMMTPLNAGVKCILMDKWDALETLRLIQEEHITHTHVVPTMFHRLLQLPEDIRRKYDLSSLRWVLHGAAPCPAHVKQAIIDWLGPIVFEYYSSTEGGGVFIGPEEWLKRPGSVGRPVQGVAIEVRNAEGNNQPPGETGTIFISAPDVGRFVYYKDEKKTQSSYKGDYFTLGDMGYLDEDGYLFLTGRSAELIISGGVNIYPAEIDEVLIQHDAVADAAVVGVPNDEWGEEIKAVVELKTGYQPDEATRTAILAFVAERVPGFQKPRSLDFVDELPRSAAGKVLRQVVRDPYWPARK